MRLTKPQLRNLERCNRILEQDVLTLDEREFLLLHYPPHAGAAHSGAFFTPYEMASDFYIASQHSGIVMDLCAGIGSLAFHHSLSNDRIICIEKDPSLAAIGKKIVPMATWITGCVFDPATQRTIGAALRHFGTTTKAGMAISNPPFGQVPSVPSSVRKRYHGKSEYAVIHMASEWATFGTFILPQTSAGFEYSGRRNYHRSDVGPARQFTDETGIQLECALSVDTTTHPQFAGANVTVEFVEADFDAATAYSPQQNLAL